MIVRVMNTTTAIIFWLEIDSSFLYGALVLEYLCSLVRMVSLCLTQ